MNKSTIKKLDPSQIRYTPKDGEIIQDFSGNYLIWKDNEWKKIEINNSGFELGLYDINKQIISQLPKLSENELCQEKNLTINSLHAKCNNIYYMLYGKEISYFTLFRVIDSDYFGYEVIECLKNIGTIKVIDFTETKDAIEIWVENENNSPTCLYLFPYDNGIVEVGE